MQTPRPLTVRRRLPQLQEDLPADASLRIGVKFKPADCTRKAKNGDKLKVHYTGTLYKDGSKFDSSRDRDAPFDLTLGQGMVIKGWDEGLFGSCAGEKRKLIIPSGKGYGASGSGAKIPGGATLVFDVEVVSIE
jgi:FKBP-type peptidyl-prolyl cis-trans isomerase